MPAMMFRPAARTADGSSCSRSGSVVAIAGTITWSRSSGSVPGGSAACAARPAASAAGVACHGSRAAARADFWELARAVVGAGGGAGNSLVQSSSATCSKVRLTARRVASRPRKRRLSPVISVIAAAGRRGRPRRASRSTSSGLNRLPRPSAALSRLSTPRLTYA